MQDTQETLRWRSGEELKKRDGRKRLDGAFVEKGYFLHTCQLCDI